MGLELEENAAGRISGAFAGEAREKWKEFNGRKGFDMTIPNIQTDAVAFVGGRCSL